MSYLHLLQQLKLNILVVNNKNNYYKGKLNNRKHLVEKIILSTEACAELGRVYTLGPELHKDLSTLQSPVLHLVVFPI
jgi:hypothetical protein